ncbi:MAG: DUF58 domain-containing protein [Anaerolineales bacterium]|nr:DUF58 domain-containing protein [Anaerolineales bacterium]
MADEKERMQSAPVQAPLVVPTMMGGGVAASQAIPGARGLRGRLVIDASKETQFSDAWIAIAIILFVAGLIFRQGSLILIAGLLALVSVVAWAWDRLALGALEYRRDFSERRAFVGETVELDLTVSNRKLLPVSWLRIDDRVPMALPLEGIEVLPTNVPTVGLVRMVYALRWYERVHRRYRIQCDQRGFFPFGPADLEAGDLFGLFSRKRRLDKRQWFIVYPRVESLTDLGLPPKEPFGPVKAQRQLFDDPIRTVGVRDHHPEDDFRRIHWKATARRQALQSRVYEPSTAQNLVIILNVATMAKHWQGYIPERMERVVSVAASAATHAVEQRWPVGILTNGALPESDQAVKVLPGRSPGQLTHIMEALAAVSPVATRQIEDLLREESPKLPWGSTLVVVTAIVTDPLKATLADLRARGRRIVLATLDEVDEADPLLAGILVRNIAGGLPAGETVTLPGGGP